MFASQGIVQNAVMTYAGWSLRDGEAPAEPNASFSSASAGDMHYGPPADADLRSGSAGAFEVALRRAGRHKPPDSSDQVILIGLFGEQPEIMPL
jgi:hypothetical protein